jgi:hypothetical protein
LNITPAAAFSRRRFGFWVMKRTQDPAGAEGNEALDYSTWCDQPLRANYSGINPCGFFRIAQNCKGSPTMRFSYYFFQILQADGDSDGG